MYLKVKRLPFFFLAIATASSISHLGAAARAIRPRYITAAILIDLKPKFLTSNLKDKASKWDKDQISKLGQSFVDKRTLLEPSSYHMTLANFEFDADKLDDVQKKELINGTKKVLQTLVDTLFPMAMANFSFVNFSRDDLNKLLQPKPQLEYMQHWELTFKNFEVVSGKKRSERHKPPHYVVASFDTDTTLLRLRDLIIRGFQSQFPQATINKDFIPHVSIARISPAVSKDDIIVPDLGGKLLLIPMNREFVRVNVEERGGEVPAGGFRPAAEVKEQMARQESYWVPSQKIVELMANGKIGEAYNTILTQGIDVTLLSPGHAKTLYEIAKDLEQRKLDKKITATQEWRSLMELLQQR